MAQPVKHYGKWRIRWIDASGRRRSENCDTRQDALLKLKRYELEAEEIRRGLRREAPVERTFDELCSYWLAQRASMKRSERHDRSIIGHHLRPFFGGMKLTEIDVSHADRYSISRAKLSKKTLSNHLTLLLSMLRLAADLKWLIEVPRIKKPRVRLFSKDFRYLRTARDIGRFLLAAQQEGELCYVLYATAIYTGMRAGELAALQWDDLELGVPNPMITVQKSFRGPTKADDVRYVPILKPLLPLLREWKLKASSDLVFINRDGGMIGESGRVFQEVLHRVLDRAKFPSAERRGKLRRYIVFHDLRHTFASHWVMNGGDLFKLQKIMGHKSPAMTQRYAHLAPEAFAADYDRIPTHLPPKPAPVLNLQSLQ